MKKYRLYKIFIIALTISVINACSESFVDYVPKGTVSADILNTPDRVDQLCTAAYASIGNDDWNVPHTSMWLFGSVRSDDAYKGGGSVADQGQMHNMEVFNLITVDMSYLNNIWVRIYQGIGRANQALRGLEQFSESEYPLLNVRRAEMRFIRGHFHFLLKILFKYPVYVDHSTPLDSLKFVSNRKYSNDELWGKIAEDFLFAYNNLPETQPEIGRANKYAAAAYLAKAKLYQSYVQDEQNNVTSINQTLLNEVITYTDYVINSEKYGLFDDIGNKF